MQTVFMQAQAKILVNTKNPEKNLNNFVTYNLQQKMLAISVKEILTNRILSNTTLDAVLFSF